MKKVFLFLVLVIVLVCFNSCSSANAGNIYLAPSSTGQIIFLRPTELKNSDSKSYVSNLVVDISIPANKGAVTGDSILNYSLITDKSVPINNDTVEIILKSGDKEFRTKDNNFMFKEAYDKNKVLLRFTSTVSKEDFDYLIDTYTAIEVFVEINGKSYSFISLPLVEKMSELELYLL